MLLPAHSGLVRGNLAIAPVMSSYPTGREGLLSSGYVDFPIADHIAHSPLKPVLRLGIPRVFDASSRLRPEIGRVVRAAWTQRNKVANLVVGVRSCGQSVSFEDFVLPSRIHGATMLSGVSTRGIAVAH
jgi:hypothetical protein